MTKLKTGPLIVFLLLAAGGFGLWISKPEVERRQGPIDGNIVIETLDLKLQNLPTRIKSYGRVTPLTETQLVARVTGAIREISDAFRAGGVFKKGDILLRLESDDYDIALKQAKAQVVEAKSRLINEQALAQEARADWKRSGRSGEPPALALREPQLKAAEAALGAAEAAVQMAELNLQRTQIMAPYDGRTLQTDVDLGSVVSPGTPLGRIFASEFAELTLPIKAKDLGLLPQPPYSGKGIGVDLTSDLSAGVWRGYLVSVLPGLDSRSRQAAVVARIDQPFSDPSSSLLVDEYVTAQIQGRVLDDVIVVPNTAIYQGTYVYVYRDGKIFRQDIRIGWFDEHQSVIEQGLAEGDQLVTTLLGQIPSGTAVKRAPKS